MGYEMQLVIDSNIIMSALIANGTTRSLIFDTELTLISPEYVLTEIEKHKQELIEKAKMDENKFNLLLELILSEITIIQKKEYERYLEEAKSLITDKDDSPFLALAICFNCVLWSNDRKIKEQQHRVNVYSTEDLIKKLR